MANIIKISKYFSLVKSDKDQPQAIFHHRTHVLYIYWDQWDLNDIDYGDLPVNEFYKLDTNQFYDLWEKIEKR